MWDRQWPQADLYDVDIKLCRDGRDQVLPTRGRPIPEVIAGDAVNDDETVGQAQPIHTGNSAWRR